MPLNIYYICLGLADDQELYQYVLYDAEPIPKGPKRINLNDGPDTEKSKAGTNIPPISLTVHLSKIPMPELQPRANASSLGQRDDRKDKAAREAEEKRRKKVGTHGQDRFSVTLPH